MTHNGIEQYMVVIPWWTVVCVLLLLVFVVNVATVAVGTARRLNRLHIRTDSARQSLEAALDNRANLLMTLQPDLHRQASKLTNVVLRADDMSARSMQEIQLLDLVNDEVLAHSMYQQACTRVDLAARFYNEAVTATLALRQRNFVRALRLAGTAPLPEYYEAHMAEDTS